MSTVDINQLANNVSTLQQDMAQVGLLVDRLDITIEKLTEVSSSVSQLLAVQGSRLEFQEKIQEKLQDLMEKRRVETDSAINMVYKRIEKVEKDIQEDVLHTEEKILKRLDELKDERTAQFDRMNNRMNRIEKWLWMVLGGSAVIGFLLNNAQIISALAALNS